jgi:DNA-binding transcriptional LysR family regulator
VTAHIQSLEREVGASLFERIKLSREIALTEIGRRTLEYAGRLLALAQETSIAIHSHSEPGGQVRVCAHPFLLAYRLSTVLRRYQTLYPQVRLIITGYPDPGIASTLEVHKIRIRISCSRGRSQSPLRRDRALRKIAPFESRFLNAIRRVRQYCVEWKRSTTCLATPKVNSKFLSAR